MSDLIEPNKDNIATAVTIPTVTTTNTTATTAATATTPIPIVPAPTGSNITPPPSTTLSSALSGNNTTTLNTAQTKTPLVSALGASPASTAQAQSSIFPNKNQTSATTPTQANPNTTSVPSNKQTRGHMDGFFSRYYSSYGNADEKGKEDFIARYLKSMVNNPQKQAAEFERLRKAGATPEELKRLSGSIDKLNAKVQANAASAVCNKGTDELNQVGRNVVADNYQRYDKTAQKDVANMIVKTNDEKVINKAASHAAECDTSNQVEIVKTYQKIDNKTVNETLINQYGQYAKENQLQIHDTMSHSKLQSTVEYAASNVWQFHKDNQAEALRITSRTGNEAAIEASAKQLAKYDESAKSEIKSIIKDTKSDKATEALDKAEQNTATETTRGDNTGTNNKNPEIEVKNGASASQSTNIAKKIENIMASNSGNKDSLINDVLKNASEAEKISFISTLSQNDLVRLIKLMLNGNSSMTVLSRAMLRLQNVGGTDKEALNNEIKNSPFAKLIKSQIGILSPELQILVLEQCAKNNDLDSINPAHLPPAAKNTYQKLQEAQKK